MPKLSLTLACWDYDRTRALLDGRVQVDGVELTTLNLVVEETFFRMLRHREFDVAEMSLSSYVLSLFREQPLFIAIPVFLSRFFRHSCIFVNADAGIRQPQDLIGKRVGVPEFQMTAAVWIRGILDEHYGVPVSSVNYFTGGQEQPGRPEKSALTLPAEIRVQPIAPDRTLSQMLAAGEIDALYTARTPSTLRGASGTVRRLFQDSAQVEREYFKHTGIFPIMHTVVIRRDLYERNRWLAQSLTKAFASAKCEAMNALSETTALKSMLPWLPHHLEETQQLMGKDFWPYGLDANRHVLETFLRYHNKQGLSPRRLNPEDLFAPEALESFVI